MPSPRTNVLRCPHCRLMQFSTKSGLCRRCRQILVPSTLPPAYAKSIGRGIRMLRLKYGLTQAQLAAALNTRRTYISTVERGVVIPSVLTIERIGAVFGLDIAGLFLAVRQMINDTDHSQVAA